MALSLFVCEKKCVTGSATSIEACFPAGRYTHGAFQRAGGFHPAPGLRHFVNRSCISALISLACLSTLPALAQSSGSAEPFVTLSVGANPTAGGVSLTGTVQPDTAGNTRHPSGTVTFLDGTTVLNANGAALAANPNLLSQTFAQVFGAPDPQMAGIFGGELVGDFDGDGKDDLLLYGPLDTQDDVAVQLFLSSNAGEANFRVLQPQTLDRPLLNLSGPVALDVDGDGKLDLLFTDTVAYGNGDGTFSRTAVLPILATGFLQTYAVDVNGDGKLDIVAVNPPPQPSNSGPAVQYTFTVFRNDGKGTFTSLGSFPLAAPVQPGQNLCCYLYTIFGLDFGDVNGDGKLDVLSQSGWVPEGNASAANNLNVMLNKGDGTFGAVKAVDASALGSSSSEGITFGDLDGDGKQDLVVAFANYSDRNFLGAALGNGDGTFGSFFQLQLINYITLGIENPQVQLVDVDGDGKLDAIVGSGEVALGKGDGTFALSTPLFAQPANPQTPLNYPLLQMPIYAHSSPSLVYLNLTSGANAAVFTPQDSSSANVSVALGAGTHTLTAHYSGDSMYAAGDSAPVTVTVAPAAATTSVTLTASPSTTFVGGTSVITASVAGLASGAGGTITFTQGSTVVPVAMQNGSASYTATFATLGNSLITATYSGDAGNASASGSISISVVASPISFPTPQPGSTILTAGSGSAAFGSVTVDAVAGYSGALSLSCSGLPANASCSFTPQIPYITGPSGTYGIIVTLRSPAPVMGKVEGFATPPGAVEWCGFSLLGLLLMGRIRRSRVGQLCLILAAGVFVSLTGCGGGKKSTTAAKLTPPGTYTFQLNAATSQMNAGPYSPAVSQTYTLIVQ